MVNQTRRKSLAKETLAILERGEYAAPSGAIIDIRADLAAALGGSRLYRPDEFPDPLPVSNDAGIAPDVEVTSETTLEAARRLTGTNALALNFASAKNPGGGFLSGSQAQEESLARSSALYACLLPMREMYERNRESGTCLYSDYMAYSPSVPMFRDDDGTLLDEPYPLSIITAPAVNTGALQRNEPGKMPLVRETMANRLAKLLWVAHQQGHRTLILGAWGCGVFRNDPAMIADLFAEALGPGGRCAGWFDHVTYAVYDRSETQPALTAFQSRFAEGIR
jgi:uncharacterized protein (TIGR02452 family)